MNNIKLPTDFEEIIDYVNLPRSYIKSYTLEDSQTLILTLGKTITADDINEDKDLEWEEPDILCFGAEDAYCDDFEDELKDILSDGDIQDFDEFSFTCEVTDCYIEDCSFEIENFSSSSGSFDEPPYTDFELTGQLDLGAEVVIRILHNS